MKWLAVIASILLFVRQDKDKKDPPGQDKKVCDLSKIEDADYCEKCKKVLYKDPSWKIDLYEKDGTCKECQSKPVKVKVCIKEWIPKCGMHQCAHDVCCCKSKTCCRVEAVRSLVLFRCESCKSESPWEDKIQHKDGVKDCKIVKVCTKNGTYPHGGELPKEK